VFDLQFLQGPHRDGLRTVRAVPGQGGQLEGLVRELDSENLICTVDPRRYLQTA
jgi:hypothetical protein